MSDPRIRAILNYLLLAVAKFPDRDADLIHMCDLADEAGEPISARNAARLNALYLKVKGDFTHD
jgi:hypothetical protein